MSHCSDSYIYNKRQLKVIFGSSTISANSESIDVKSEPVFYLNKATDNRYQDSKESCRDRTSQYPKDDYRSSRDQSSRNGYHSVLLPSPSSLLGGGRVGESYFTILLVWGDQQISLFQRMEKWILGEIFDQGTFPSRAPQPLSNHSQMMLAGIAHQQILSLFLEK